MFFFFCTACWLSLDFSRCLLFFLRRQSPVSQWEMINSKLQTAFEFIVLKFSKPAFLFFPSSVFLLVQPGKKYNWFFFSFCLLFGACAQWKHSPLSVAHVTSFFVLVSFWFPPCLQCLSAVLLKAMQQWFLPILLFRLLVRVGCGMISCILHW